MGFQWVLGEEELHCVASRMLLLHMQEMVFCWFSGGSFVLSGGGGGGGGGGGADILAPGLHMFYFIFLVENVMYFSGFFDEY